MVSILKLSLQEEIAMSKGKHKKKKEKSVLSKIRHELHGKITWKVIVKICGYIVALCVFVVTAICSMNFALSDFNNKFANIDEQFTSVNERLDKMDGQLDGIDKRLDNLNGRVSILEGFMKAFESGQATAGFQKNMECLYTGGNASPIDATVAVMKTRTNKELSARELVDKKLLLTYKVGDSENVFYGQFNQNCHWDGQCIINSYKGGELDFMADATYDDGELIDYKQVFRKKETSEEIWVASVRECDGETNHGESWDYTRKSEVAQDFSLESVAIANLVWPNVFIDDELRTLVGYYNGDTSNGSYNDVSGKAYLIKYKKDGTISMLYKGVFVDGQPADTKGISWEIIWDGVNAYNYYKGTFSDGKKDGDEFTEKNLSLDRIQELTVDIDFNFSGLWGMDNA